jgi:hypothetical protein
MGLSGGGEHDRAVLTHYVLGEGDLAVDGERV